MGAFLGSLSWFGGVLVAAGGIAVLAGVALLFELQWACRHGAHWARRWHEAPRKNVDRLRSAYHCWELSRSAVNRRDRLRAWKDEIWEQGSQYELVPLGIVLLLAWVALVVLNLPLLGLIMDLFFAAGQRVVLPLVEEPLSIGAVLFAGLVAVLETLAGIFALHGRTRAIRVIGWTAVAGLSAGEMIGAWIRTELMGQEIGGALGQIMAMGPAVAAVVGFVVPSFEALSAGQAWGYATQYVVKRMQWLGALICYVIASPFLILYARIWSVFHEQTGASPPPPPQWPVMCDPVSELEDDVAALEQSLQSLEKEQISTWCRELEEAAREAGRMAEAHRDVGGKIRRQMDRGVDAKAAALSSRVEMLQQQIDRLIREASASRFPQKVAILVHWDWRFWDQKRRNAREKSQLFVDVGVLTEGLSLNGLPAPFETVQRLDEIGQRCDDIRSAAASERSRIEADVRQFEDGVQTELASDHTPVPAGDTIAHGACGDVLDRCEKSLRHAVRSCADRVLKLLREGEPGRGAPSVLGLLERCDEELSRARGCVKDYVDVQGEYAAWAEAVREKSRRIASRLEVLRP